MRSFGEFTRKHVSESLFFDKVKFCRSAASLKTRLQRWCFLANIAKFLRTPFLQNTTTRLLLIIAVSIVLVIKGELASGTVNYDTKTMYQFEPQVQLIKKDTPGETASRSQTSVFKNFVESTRKHLCLSLLACNSIKEKLQYRYFPMKFTKFLETPF